MKIYISTSDKYLQLLKPFSFLFNRFWGEQQDVVVLGYKEPDFELPNNFEFVSMGVSRNDPKEWSDGLRDYFKSIDLSLKTLNDFLQGEFFEKIESLDWKIWEMHQKMEKNDKVIEILEDLKSLLRVHLMNDGSQSSSVEEVSGKPTSIVGKLFKK